ncbi:MutS-related protein [Aquisphaera giovannonii]|uniref:MutS-related protein n=1 Tax=Aquisphaera giovannonii TaxID=406548 RepID=UPI001FE74318|nr:DNA mismatch repair protein MutS [Aquisphaera giovannonii]
MPNDAGERPASAGLRAEYGRRLEDRRAAQARWSKLEGRVADARLAAFAAALAVGFLAFWLRRVGPLWLAPIGVAFLALVLVHEPLRRRSRRMARAAEFYSRGVDRMADRWAGKGVAGLHFLDLDHPYAADLDLFGVGSLFERLCTARTRSGEDTLAGWLLRPSTPAQIAGRHEAVDELRPRLDLREDLELLGADVRSGIDPEALAAWGRSPRVFPGRALRVAAATLAAAGALALIGWAFLGTGLLPLAAVLAVEWAFAYALSGRARRVLEAVDRRAQDLVLLGALLDRLEREPFRAARLGQLRMALEARGRPASEPIRRLARLVHLLDARRNQLLAPFAAVLLWGTQFAMAIDAWRGEEGPAIADWLAAMGEFEALCALAAYAAENPEDPWPEVVPGGARFEARAIGHPLIPAAKCVRNDVELGGEARALVVSGSNMSGKSTLLRTVGVAAVMSFAGLPVRAAGLRISPLSIGATLRIQDSLQAGKSRFFAEITRVRQVVGLAAGPPPLLFLFDEIFHGTNSHDRTIGAEAVLRGLIDRGAIGLITTHDLALAAIVDRIGGGARNVHFEDRFEGGRMHFDYTMRPGVVEHSNALALMRAVGLDV